MRRLARESIRPYWRWIVLAFVFMALVAATTGLSAYLMKPVVNEIFVERNAAMLIPIAAAILGTFALKGFANYGQSVTMSYVGQRIITDMQHRLYAHITSLELGYFHATPIGSLISRFTIDIGMMRAAVSTAITGFGKDALSVVALVTVMFIQDWILALIAFVVFPIAVVPIARIGQRIRKVTANTQEEIGQFATILEQTFQGARVVKAYRMEEYEEGRVKAIAERVFALIMRATRIRSIASPIMETLGGVAVVLVILYGGFRVIEDALDPGSFFSFIMALLVAYEPVKRLANLNTALQEGLASADRVFALLDREPVVQERANPKTLAVTGGKIEFRDVAFSYENTDQQALDGLTLNVPAGKMAALVGPSGAGKSTILNLIPRFYDVARGAVLIDGHDVRDLSFESLRGAIGLVSQEIILFDDTVRANIAYGKQGASESEIVAAAKAAAAHDFIMDLPDGYDTEVGERGVRISGGQRQRLAIARAMLKNAPILLLDEATSSLDTESERQVQAALDRLTENRTTLVIAHRLSTVMNADVIHVIERGRVAESGNHAQLIARDGLYARLYALQFATEDALQTEPRHESRVAAGE
jgi:subfamily B ATP-binding cassette protein MsbA